MPDLNRNLYKNRWKLLSCNFLIALVATIDLSIKTDQELAQTIFEHRVTENCLYIFNFNGTSTSMCQKSKILQEMQSQSVDYFKYIEIVDIGLLRSLSPPSSSDRKKGDGTVYTWKDYVENVFKTILKRHHSASMMIAANDYYGNDVINAKDGEI